jgi:hypothetical protein
MAELFLGITTTGSRGVVRFGAQRWWAERGLIHMESSTDNSYHTYSVRTVLERIRALSDMLGNRREAWTEDQFDQALRHYHQDFVDAMSQLCQKAREQGEPWDARARRDMARRLPKTVVMSATMDL